MLQSKIQVSGLNLIIKLKLTGRLDGKRVGDGFARTH